MDINASTYLTVDEVATYLRISRSGVYRLFDEGAIPRATIRGRVIVPRTALDEYVNSLLD